MTKIINSQRQISKTKQKLTSERNSTADILKTTPSKTQRYGKSETTCVPTSVLDSEYSRSAPFIQLGGIRKLSTRKSGACIMSLELRRECG